MLHHADLLLVGFIKHFHIELSVVNLNCIEDYSARKESEQIIHVCLNSLPRTRPAHIVNIQRRTGQKVFGGRTSVCPTGGVAESVVGGPDASSSEKARNVLNLANGISRVLKIEFNAFFQLRTITFT